jgi:glutathione S-transferase
VNIELYFAPGACSFVPHAALEAIKAATGQEFTPKLVKLHKGEHRTPEYLALNPNGQVPVLAVDGKPINQIVSICDWLDRSFPKAGLLPAEPWARTQAMSQLAWMNNTAHPTFTHVFFPDRFADTESAHGEVKRKAAAQFRGYLARIQEWLKDARPFLNGERPGFLDFYSFTLLRWGGYAGIDPASLPTYKKHVEQTMKAAPVAAALERERVKLDTYKAAG